MNKELIKKYKVEFDHWLGGGKLLAYYKTDEEPKWWTDKESINYGGDDNFSNIIKNSLSPSGVLIVIDDEYVELRKALAEGKTIQLNEAEKFSDQNRGWVDLSCTSLGSSTNLFPVEYYRIKPEEPEFKVGDWVRDKKRKHKPFMVTSSDLEADSPNYVKIDCELWQPQPGEWCWVGYKLMKFNKLIKEDYSTTFEFISPYRDADGYKIKEYILERHLQIVEPFIGQLPTILKD